LADFSNSGTLFGFLLWCRWRFWVMRHQPGATAFPRAAAVAVLAVGDLGYDPVLLLPWQAKLVSHLEGPAGLTPRLPPDHVRARHDGGTGTGLRQRRRLIRKLTAIFKPLVVKFAW
jgi:hypothetical protein